MHEHDVVTVYSFLVQSFPPEMATQARFKAPRALIIQKFQGQVLEGTAEQVPISELDAEGRYRRIATGWGELS